MTPDKKEIPVISDMEIGYLFQIELYKQRLKDLKEKDNDKFFGVPLELISIMYSLGYTIKYTQNLYFDIINLTAFDCAFKTILIDDKEFTNYEDLYKYITSEIIDNVIKGVLKVDFKLSKIAKY